VTAERVRSLSAAFRSDLLDDTLAFWLRHGIDREHGGYLTFLDRRGEVLSDEKGGWVHGRFVWLLARLYNEIEPRDEWLDAARHGLEFIERHGFAANGRMYFTMAKDGRGTRVRRYVYTEVFAVMAFAEMGRATGDRRLIDRARQLANRIEELLTTSGALPAKFEPGGQEIRVHSETMVKVDLYRVLRRADPDNTAEYTSHIDTAIDAVFRFFVKPKSRALLETVSADGSPLDGPAGRCINSGHALETAWFILEEAAERGDEELIASTVQIIDWTLSRGWDDDFGGLYSFVDIDGRQPEQVNWDMKYWWPHNEALYATLLAYRLTGASRFARWFETILAWVADRFPDPKYGEWYGYLHRDGSVAMDLKGNNWKGPFHLPRQQLLCHQLLEQIYEQEHSVNSPRPGVAGI
jgi:N-acylglucosamine 2-epimerase